MQTHVFHLLKKSSGTPLQHNVGLDGRPTGQPGVTAIVVSKGALKWGLLADHPKNPGVSVTNAATSYAEAVCNVLSCSIDDIAWFELDSSGCFDQLELLGEHASFKPLHEPGHKPRSLAAFLARVTSLFGDLPKEAADAIQTAHAQFS